MLIAQFMKKSRTELIETVRLITSIVTLGLTLLSLIRAFMDWQDRYN